MEEEIAELKKTIDRLQNLVRVANDRIARLEEKVAPLHRERADRQGNTITFDGEQNKSALGRSLGEIYNNTITTSYPLRNYGGPGVDPDAESR